MTSLTDTGATDGTIDVDATGGTPPLLYELYKVNPTDTTFEDSNNSGDFSGLGEGLYYVLVTDANGCGPKESVDFNISAIEITLAADSVLCAGDASASVYAQVTGGVLPYTYEWTSLDTSDMSEDTVRVIEDTPIANDTLNNVTAGFYILNAIDSTGINTRDTIEVYEPEPVILDSISPDSSILCAGNQEQFVAHVSGGVTPYTINWYEKATMDSITTGDTVTVGANSYYIAITDANGCYTLDSVTITEPAPITITNESYTSISGPGASDGTIDVDATGGTPPLTYELYEIEPTDTTFVVSNNNGEFSGLSEGIYYVLVDDVNGCGPVESSDFNISPMDIILTSDSVDCSGDSTGAVYAQVNGGVLPYTYEWTSLDTSDMSEDTVRVFEDSPFANDTLQNAVAGFYILNVLDSTGVNTRDTIEVIEPEPLLLDSVGPDNSVLCYGDQETFIAYVSGGVSPYTITWYEKATMDSVTSGDTVTLGANSYYIGITDNNGCFIMDSVNITQPDEITIVSEDFTPLSSSGASDGTIDIDATGGTPPLEYILYKFTPTDTTGVDTTTDGDFTGLSEGDYFVVVTDVNGCDSAKSSDIRIAPLEINFIEVEPVTCAFDSSGRVIAEVNGGFAPYDFEWTTLSGDTVRTKRGSSSNTDTLSNIPGGSYILNVIDNINNTDKDTVFVYEPKPLTVVEILPDTLSALGASDGSIEVTTTGGNDTIFFDINNLDDGSSATQSTTTVNDTANVLFTNLTGGLYEVIVYDNNGCGYLTDTVNVVHYELTMDKESLACSGDTDGMAIANIDGGTPPFIYDWSTEPTFVDTSRTDTLTGLSAGWYYVTVTDHYGFELEDSIYVDEPAPITFAIDTVAGTSVYDFYSDTALLNCPEDTAEFYISPVGGTSPYTIVWYNKSTMDTVAVGDSIVLNYNDYLRDTTGFIVEVTDSNGCSEMDELTIIQPEPVQITNISPDWTTISNNLTVGGVGGNSRLIFRLIKQDGADTTLYPADSTYFMQGDTTFAVFQGIPGGNYLLEAYDSAYCEPDYLEISIPMKIEMHKVQKISCPGSGDGIVSVEVLRGNPPFTYRWSTYDTLNQSYVTIKQSTTSAMHDTLYNLSKGWYYVEVIDSFDVSVTDSIYLDESDPIEVLAQTSQAYCASDLIPTGQETGAVRLNVSGGTPYSDGTYSYSWFSQAPERGKDSLVNITGGTYGFTVIDSLGCTYTDTVQVSSNSNYDIQLSIGAFRDTICMNDNVKLYPQVINKVDSLYWSPMEEEYYSVNDLDTITDSPNEETRYSIHAKNARCMTSEAKVVSIYPTLEPYILEDDEEMDDQLSFLEIVNEVNLTAIVENDDSIADSLITYLWEPANYFTSVSGLQSTLSIENLREDEIPNQPVWFTAEVDHGSDVCYETDSIMVNIVPNVTPTDAFSPNGDGINDTWKLKDANTYDNLEVIVFNRWGIEVFRRRPYRNDNAWDGTNSRGKPLPSGTYYYIIDSHEKGVDILSGTVTIIR
jgi:gliding motility-associated-like protein